MKGSCTKPSAPKQCFCHRLLGLAGPPSVSVAHGRWGHDLEKSKCLSWQTPAHCNVLSIELQLPLAPEEGLPCQRFPCSGQSGSTRSNRLHRKSFDFDPCKEVLLMRETETKATTAFASAVRLEGVDLNLEDRDDCTSHLRWAQIKSFHFLLPKARCHWLIERHRQQGLGWLIELPLAPALSWIKSIINPLLGPDHLQQAFKPLRSSMCLNHHSLKCSISRCWQQTSCFGSCTAAQSKQAASHGALIDCPKPP